MEEAYVSAVWMISVRAIHNRRPVLRIPTGATVPPTQVRPLLYQCQCLHDRIDKTSFFALIYQLERLLWLSCQ